MRLTSLADDCRAAGLEVNEIPGWKTAGGELGAVGAVIAHHTATGVTSLNATVLHLLRYGRPDLNGPLCQVGLDRKGVVHLIASGTANHAGTGSWRGVAGNSRAVGVEAFNSGTGEPWAKPQLAAWDRLNAVLLRTLGLPADALCGHKEWTPRKVDPFGLDMDQMRARAAALLDDPPPEAPDMTPHESAQLASIAENSAETRRMLAVLLGVQSPAGSERRPDLDPATLAANVVAAIGDVAALEVASRIQITVKPEGV